MKPSKYNLFVPSRSGERVFATNLMSRSAVDLPLQAHEKLESWAQCGDLAPQTDEEQQFAEFLIRNLYWVTDDFDELEYVKGRVSAERFESRQVGIVIAPTMDCNFACHYCFERKAPVRLGPHACDRLVDFVTLLAEDCEELSIQWFGGEPLLEMASIEELSRRLLAVATRAGISYSAAIITNGFLMTKEISHRLHALGVNSVQITFDGDRHLHNRTRRERNGSGSFDEILQNIRDTPPGMETVARVHLAPYNAQSVFRLLDELADQGMQPSIDSLYFAPLFNYRVGSSSTAYETDGILFSSSAQFAELQVKLMRRARMLGFRIKDILDVSYSICTAVRTATHTVDAYGHILKCYKDVGAASEAHGDLFGGEQNEANLAKWLDFDFPRDEECADCPFLPTCLCGCAKQWQEHADKSVICTPLKFNYRDIIRLYFDDYACDDRTVE